MFAIVLFIQICVILYYCNTKIGLFGDEIWSFNLANKYFDPYLGYADIHYNKWLTSEFWNSIVVVSSEHKFSYDSVLYNQSVDSHPPFYYILLHTICSFFPGVFNKWFGFSINIVFFVLSQIALYKFCSEIYKDKFWGLMICFFYGFCWGTINNTTYIRMYSMLVFWGILSFFWHVKLLNDFSVKKLGNVFLVSLLGILTQYHFLVYQFFVSLYFVIMQIIKRNYKILFQYSSTYVVLLLTVFFIYPPIVGQIFGNIGMQSPQGQVAIDNLFKSNIVDRLNIFGYIISKDVFGAHFKSTIYIIFVLLFLGILKRFIIFDFKYDKEDRRLKLSLSLKSNNLILEYKFGNIDELLMYALFVTVLFFVMTAKIAPFYVTRYMVIIHPLIAVFFVSVLKNVWNLLSEKKSIFLVFAIIYVFSCSLSTYGRRNLFEYDYDIKNVITQIDKDSSNNTCIIIRNGRNWWPLINKVLVFREMENSYIIEEKDIDSLPMILERKNISKERLFIYKDPAVKLKDNEFKDFCKKQLGYSNVSDLSSYYGKTYLLSSQR